MRSCDTNHIADVVFVSYRWVLLLLLCRRWAAHRWSPRWRPGRQSLVARSTRRREWAKWWSARVWVCQRRDPCAHAHNPPNSDGVNASSANWSCPDAVALVLAVAKCYATLHTKLPHKLMNTQWCRERGTVRHPVQVCPVCWCADIRKFDRDPSVPVVYANVLLDRWVLPPVCLRVHANVLVCDVKCVAYDSPDCRMLIFRVSSPVSTHSAKLPNWCRSYAWDRSVRWFYSDKPWFAASKRFSVNAVIRLVNRLYNRDWTGFFKKKLELVGVFNSCQYLYL